MLKIIRRRTASNVYDIGFTSAMALSHQGIECVGKYALLANISGRVTRLKIACGVSILVVRNVIAVNNDERELSGFYLNCGYWAGVMLGPGAGKRVADLVTGALAPADNALRPTRYAEGAVVKGDSFLRGRH